MSPSEGNALVQGLYAGILNGMLPRLAAVIFFALAIMFGVRTGNMVRGMIFFALAVIMTFGVSLFHMAGF